MDAGRGGWFRTLLLGLLSLVPRLYVALAWSREPVWDGHYYDFGARRIAQGLGYSDDVVVHGASVWHPWCHYPVGYSGFLGGIYALVGEGQHVAPIANAVLGSIIVMLTHRIGMHWLSPARALLAAVLCGVNLELVFYSPLVMTEILATTLPLVAIWVALAWRGSMAGHGVAGGVLGLGTLVQPQTILLAPVLGWAVAPGAPWSRKRALAAAITTVAALLVVAPWTLRNCRVMDGCAFVSTNGGWNLAIGSFPRATGRFETLRSSDGCSVVTGQVQQDRCWANLGVGWIQDDFRRWIGLAPVKMGQCFDHASFPVEYLGQADPGAWPETVRQRWREWLTTLHRLLLSAAAFGFVAFRVRDVRGLVVETALRAMVAGFVAHAWFADVPAFWPLALCIVFTGLLPRRSAPALGPVGLLVAASFALFVVTHVAFFGEDRYHVRLIPMMCLLVAAVARRARS